MFEELDLDSPLLKAIAEAGYKNPTSIQSLAIPEILSGRDVMASAPTGTGKTAAFLLPAIQHLLDVPRRNPGFSRVLIMTPTRELAIQIYEQAKEFGKYTNLRIGVVTGGVNYGSHAEIFEKNNDILISTPGRLLDYLRGENFHAEDVEMLILDEADRMLDMGFRADIEKIIEEAKNRKQSLLFSATLEGRSLEHVASQLLTDPARVEADPARKEKGKIHQWIHLADNMAHKQALLTHILQNEDCKRAVIFVKTRERVQQIASLVQAAEIRCCWLQGEMPQDKRNTAIERFSNGRVNVLIATDVAARGIDIDDITHVINFDLPRTADVYLHRIGRTARAGKKGIAISLVEAHDMAILGKIERYTKAPLPRRIIDSLRPQNKEAKIPAKKKKVKVSNKLKKAKAKKVAKKQSKKTKKPE